MKTTVHALFVGINQYEGNVIVDRMATFPPLGGCVNDVVAVRDLLAKDASIDLQDVTLTDRQATKANIVKAFEEHLGQAGPDDVALFYYSGHGTVEKADADVWTTESDGRLEGIVCYYTDGESGKFLLSDKELRYMLAELYAKTKAHIVTIFDCCHSGDNTRAVLDAVMVNKRPQFRSGFLTFPQRKWEDFVFAKKFQPDFFRGKGLDDALPPGRYVQLAACESNESALETNGHGVLTSHLLAALRQTGGNLSYRDLASRIRNQTKYLFEQRPRFYTPNDATDLADLGFLKKPIGATATQAQLIYNQAGEYRLDRGILHHVEPGVTTVTTAGKDGRPVTGLVTSAELDAAVVEFSHEALANLLRSAQPTAQPATLANLSNRMVRIQLVNKDLADKYLQPLLNALNQPDNAGYFAFEDDATKADYSLVLWKGMAYFVRPGDLFRPLVLPVKSKKTGAGEKIARQLRHISQWKFAEGLRNQGQTPLPVNHLKVEFFTVDADGMTETPLAVGSNGEVRPTLSQRADGKWKSSVKVKLTNQSDGDLYVAAPYCSYDFSCDTTALLNPAVIMLSKGESKWLRDHKDKTIPFKLNETVRLFNWPESQETLKLLFSVVPFENIAALELAALPAPTEMNKSLRGSIEDEESEEERGGKRQKLQVWNSRDFKIILANPLYDQPEAGADRGELERIFGPDSQPNEADADLAHFLSGVYFDKKSGLQSGIALKNGQENGNGLERTAQRGIWWNTLLAGANKWSNFQRNRDFTSAVKEFPDRAKIISEGDSWFQHPTIADIIDHVSKFYPVHCLAAAGDTIRNWAREGQIFKAVSEQQPAVVLLSGGGNDILGESMLKFLADKYDDAPEGEQFERFFSDVFQPELDALIGEYRTIFSYFKTNYPQMPVLVHGYDYPRPLAADSKKTSWLGKYLTEKKIMREKDRTAAVRYMMNEFNERLEKAAKEFPDQVHYLDLRSIVRDDQWSDEIHPNADGFQDVSQKFILKINELLAAKPTN